MIGTINGASGKLYQVFVSRLSVSTPSGKSDDATLLCTRTLFSKEVPAGKMTARGSTNASGGNLVR